MHLQTRLEIRVAYAAPARDCRRVLRVLPLHREGQNVLREGWKVSPDANFTLEKRDGDGNRRLVLFHRRIAAELRFGLRLEVETSGAPVLDASPDRAKWKMPSRAIVFTPEIQNLARQVRDVAPLSRAAHFARFCGESLEYHERAEACPLDAARVLARESGNCADFAHLFLALCRTSGLMARYVAGFSRSQGQMHAWAEVWDQNYWHAFDATRELDSGAARPVTHIAVAVGRDFYDCAPHSGQFRGAGAAQIEVWCQTHEAKSD